MFTILLGILTLILVTLHFLKQYKARKLPPGPVGLPVFGYYFFLGKNPMLKLRELSKTYGNVFGLYIGSQYIVVLNDWPTAKQTLNRTTILDRPDAAFARVPYKFGISGTNGHEWLQNRRVTSRAIKEVGLNRVAWDDLLQGEILDWVQSIMQENGKPLDVNDFFAQRFVSTMMELILGVRLSSEHPSMGEFSEAVNTIMDRSSVLELANVSPFLGKLLNMLAMEDASVMTRSVKRLTRHISDTVDSKIQELVKAVEKDSFIGRFQEEIENQRKDVVSFITVDSLKGNALALLTASGETTRSALIWTLIAMAEHPDKQQRVHEELDSVIGKEGVLRWGEQAKVPYTFASLLESMRWRTLLPFIMRRSTEDLEINGYQVPKGTPFVFNTWAMHNDLRFWRNPEQFIPERFLLENGQKVDSAPESFNAFSVGKRSCLGKQIALKFTFLMFTILMQKFKVMPKSGEKVEYDTNLGLSYQPRNVELRFIPK